MEPKRKYLHYKRLSLVTEQQNPDGTPKPFRVLYSAMNGDVIAPSDGDVVVTSVDREKRNRTVKFLQCEQVRTLADCLFLSVLIPQPDKSYTEYIIQAN